MLSIVLSPDPNMQAKRKSIQQELDLENGCNILETKKPKLKGAKYVRECYARKRLQLKNQQAEFWKFINKANDWMLDETTKLLDAWIPKEAVHLYYAGNWNKQTQIEFYEKKSNPQNCGVDLTSSLRTQFVFACSNYQHNINIDGLPPLGSMHLAV